MNKVMEAAIKGHHKAGHTRVSPLQITGRGEKFSADKTATGYEPHSEILLRDQKTKYQVQEDGSFRKVEDQAPGEFNQVLRDAVGRNKRRKK